MSTVHTQEFQNIGHSTVACGLAPDKNGANGVTPFLSGEGPNSAGKTALRLLTARTEGLINFAMTGIRLRRRRSQIHNNICVSNFGRIDISNLNILTSASLWGFFPKQRIIWEIWYSNGLKAFCKRWDQDAASFTVVTMEMLAPDIKAWLNAIKNRVCEIRLYYCHAIIVYLYSIRI